jgi:transposase-like protein
LLEIIALGTPVADVCRRIGISEATCYVWKKYAELDVAELQQHDAFLIED